jgi:hypothetical protein
MRRTVNSVVRRLKGRHHILFGYFATIYYDGDMRRMKSIIGSWEWKETTISSRGVRPPNDRVTPQSAGYTEQRKFLPNGQVEFYKDGELTGIHSYSIESIKDLARSQPRYRISIDGTISMMKISNSRLVIGFGGTFGQCGADTIYVKIK